MRRVIIGIVAILAMLACQAGPSSKQGDVICSEDHGREVRSCPKERK